MHEQPYSHHMQNGSSNAQKMQSSAAHPLGHMQHKKVHSAAHQMRSPTQLTSWATSPDCCMALSLHRMVAKLGLQQQTKIAHFPAANKAHFFRTLEHR